MKVKQENTQPSIATRVHIQAKRYRAEYRVKQTELCELKDMQCCWSQSDQHGQRQRRCNTT